MTARTILITGCSSGIGYTCAIGMQQRGWRVIATARKPDDIAMLKTKGLEVLQLDYTDASSIAACAQQALKLADGKLDAVFNNGAYGQPGLVEDLSVGVLREQFEANFFGWHDLTTRLIPAMRDRGSGRIVQCSSVLGIIAAPYRGAYNASKFALEGLTDTLRLELHGSGIKVSSILPGPIRSRFTLHALNALRDKVDTAGSRHHALYAKRIAELEATAGAEPAPLETPEESRKSTGNGLLPQYRLGPDAVLDCLIHATESANPKPHYHVTYTTRMAALARRLLPDRWQEKLALRSS
ncbi:SDR family NAD(P)-dependent oxidoreductase [Anderseniella sp. Alg231-50]|uniref:SDR family NAD(P)-dependent oxidoreductase n=1 Tax=Anderseniella sp. Alg231-50 TaxID=1922226 RepID=UPI000D55CE4B